MPGSKVIVITGVTQGIGRSMVDWFIKNGHQVLGCGRSKDAISALNKQYENQNSCFSVSDVSDHVSVESWVKECLTNFPSPDILINNAGINGKSEYLSEYSIEEFNKVIDVNIKGTNNVVHYFLPAMLKAKKGAIINMSSGWGRSTSPKVVAYCCSKWGVEGFSSALAQELPAPLVCAALNPGLINTEMLQGNFDKQFTNQQRNADEWARDVCPFILSINRNHNGRQLTAP